MPRAASQNVIHCANCLHCKVFPGKSIAGRPERRVRCDKGHWRTDLGAEKTYSYHTVTRRLMRACGDYDSMGEATKHAFLRDLEDTLPAERGL